MSVPIKPVMEVLTIVPIRINYRGIVPVIEFAVLGTSEVALDVCVVPLVVAEVEFTSAHRQTKNHILLARCCCRTTVYRNQEAAPVPRQVFSYGTLPYPLASQIGTGWHTDPR